TSGHPRRFRPRPWIVCAKDNDILADHSGATAPRSEGHLVDVLHQNVVPLGGLLAAAKRPISPPFAAFVLHPSDHPHEGDERRTLHKYAARKAVPWAGPRGTIVGLDGDVETIRNGDGSLSGGSALDGGGEAIRGS